MSEPAEAPVSPVSDSVGRSIGALMLGLLIVALGYLIALSDGMASAPQGLGYWLWLPIIVGGFCLVGLGLASMFLVRWRPLAGKATLVGVLLLLGFYVIGQLLMATGLTDG